MLAFLSEMILRIEARSTKTQTNDRPANMSDGDPPYFSVVEAIIFERQVRTGEKNFGQR
jgi:hypothetical protein